MLAYLINNAGTILVGLVILLVVSLILRSMYRERKAGKGGCGCSGGCSGCGMACHSNDRK